MLLRPSRELKRRIHGVLARAAGRHDVGVCTFIYLSNHCHLLLRPASAANLAAFMNHLNSNVGEAMESLRQHRFPVRFPNHGVPPPARWIAAPA